MDPAIRTTLKYPKTKVLCLVFQKVATKLEVAPVIQGPSCGATVCHSRVHENQTHIDRYRLERL